VLWVYVIVALGLVGILVETFLSFRKEMRQVDEDVRRVRAGIRQHEEATAGLEGKRAELEAHNQELRAEWTRSPPT
jgi:cytochrome c biogenesis protein ResB